MYSFVLTLVSIILALLAIKWKITAYAVTMFCIEKFRKPTNKEIAEYTKKTISNFLKRN